MKSVLDITVSGFKNVKSTEPRPINLLSWLSSTKYRSQVEKIRQTESKEERSRLKKQLPAITPSGEFSQRNESGLIRHTGLMCLDIDKKDNTHISNYSDLKNQLANISNFAYVGYSVGGSGFFCLVPIAEPKKHKLHFKALQADMAEFGIILDNAGSDITRLRFYSYDNEAYFNHQARVYTKVYQEPVKVPKMPTMPTMPPTGRSNFEKLLKIINTTGTDITGDYQQWFEIGCSLANEFGASGLDYFHDISRFSPKYEEKATDRQFKQCLKHGYRYNLDTFFYYAKLNRVTLDKCKQFKTPPPAKMPKVPPAAKEIDYILSKPQDPEIKKFWTVDKLEEYFNSVDLPEPPIKMEEQKLMITDPQIFVETFFSEYKKAGNTPYMEAYLVTLRAFAEKIKSLRRSKKLPKA